MNIKLNAELAIKYSSQTQFVRVITETWVKNEIFCPKCGRNLNKLPNNNPAGDFECNYCREEFELKSKKGNIGKKIIDGAYDTMIERLNSDKNPNFFFLQYQLYTYEVQNFFVVPKYFFISNIIEKRKPLSKTARRSGWIGCNILLTNIPESGKIYYLRNNKVENKEKVIESWNKVSFLRETRKELKGWILDVMECIDKIGKETFTLKEIYQFENYLYEKHPDNRHIKDKIRQQLQYLRDMEYLEFIEKGIYRKK